MPKKNEILHTVLSDYRIVRPIGSGGAGNVFEALDSDGTKCAIKVLNEQATKGKRKRFLQEVEYCRRTSNPSIVAVSDVGLCGEGAGVPFYVMPLYDCSLRSLMAEGYREPPKQFSMFVNLLEGIARFHAEGNIHRDIKPENILVDLEEDRLVLVDFGIAHVAQAFEGATVVTRKDDRLANFAYASPEQRMRAAKVDRRSDIFSLGLVMVELFTGSVPYGTNFEKIADVWEEYAFLDEVAERMLAQSAHERYSDLHEVLIDIEVLAKEAAASSTLAEIESTGVTSGDSGQYAVAIENMEWREGTVFVHLSEQPDATWIQAFQSNPTNYFTTAGYRFGPRYWEPFNKVIAIDNVGKDESKVVEIRDNFPVFIECANAEATRMAAERRRSEHAKEVADAEAERSRAKAIAEASSRFNRILSSLSS